MNSKNQPGAGYDSPNAPHSTLQLGYHSLPEPDGYSRQELRAKLRAKAALEIHNIGLLDTKTGKRRALDRLQRKWAEAEMCARWFAQIDKVCAKESLSTKLRYPREIVDQVMTMQNVHDDVVKEALGL